MPHCSVCMPFGWNGLSMPTEGCSVCMPIVITNLKVKPEANYTLFITVYRKPTHTDQYLQ